MDDGSGTCAIRTRYRRMISHGTRGIERRGEVFREALVPTILEKELQESDFTYGSVREW